MDAAADNRGSRVAIDIGGTFTDLVAYSEASGKLLFSKSLTTYDSLSNGVFDCLRLADVGLADVGYLFHGSTIAINTVIQRKGAVTGLITTAGFGDIYAIGRGTRPDPYNLMFDKVVPLVSRDLIAEVDERMDARGNVRRPLDPASVETAVKALLAKGVESIAVVLLHAYRNPDHEKAVRDVILKHAPDMFVSLSHEILREFREYERTSTTVLNAYIGPIVGRYVGELKDNLKDGGFEGNFLIMQSNGGTMSADAALVKPVAMMESGPVAGVIGCAQLGRELGHDNVISFDMGGTTAKASLIEKGETRVVTGYQIGDKEAGHPMMLPVVDIVEVGAGGGSIAWIDAAGGLKVGPISAGSTPGPACYGGGGEEPTITDANLVLGRLDPDNFLGGQMKLDLAAARRVIEAKVARPLGMTVEDAALGILRIADTKMSLAVREVSVAKGHDPRGFALIATGGAGPLHAVSIARELSLPTVIVPDLPGTFSALGMLMSDIRHDFVRTFIVQMDRCDPAVLEATFAEMGGEAADALRLDGVEGARAALTRTFDMRYVGQEYTLSVPVPSGALTADALQTTRARFDAAHQAQYSHSAPEEAVEIVNLRLAAIGIIGNKGQAFDAPVADSAERTGRIKTSRKVYFDSGAFDCPVYDRAALIPDELIAGPAVIEEKVSTTIVGPNCTARLSVKGPIIIELAGE